MSRSQQQFVDLTQCVSKGDVCTYTVKCKLPGSGGDQTMTALGMNGIHGKPHGHRRGIGPQRRGIMGQQLGDNMCVVQESCRTLYDCSPQGGPSPPGPMPEPQPQPQPEPEPQPTPSGF